MKPLVPFVSLAAAVLVGCSSFTAVQFAPDGTETRVKIKTFLDSKSEVAKLRTTQTEKTQGISLGVLTQESTSTNLAESFRAAAELLKAAVPK